MSIKLILLKNGMVYHNGEFKKLDILIKDGVIIAISDNLNNDLVDGAFTFNLDHCFLLPGFTDCHVHLSKPGIPTTTDDIKIASILASAGGYLSIACISSIENGALASQFIDNMIQRSEKIASVNCHFYGPITSDERGHIVTDIEGLSDRVIGYTNSGNTKLNDDSISELMTRTSRVNKPVIIHPSIVSKLTFNRFNGTWCLKPQLTVEEECMEVAKNIKIASITGCHYHVSNVSCAEVVDLIRKSKQEGINVTCDTAPHYLLFNDINCLSENFNIFPNLRSIKDQLALINGIKDGTIDILSVDHVPPEVLFNIQGMAQFKNRLIDLDVAFPVLYEKLVLSGIISLEKLLSLLIDNPNRIFNIGSEIEVGKPFEMNAWHLDSKYRLNSSFSSLCAQNPLLRKEVHGKLDMTYIRDMGNRL